MKSVSYYIENKSLVLKENELGPLKDGFVRVKVRCSGVNRADILHVMGAYPSSMDLSLVPGLEFSGEILENKSSEAKYVSGERVIGLVKGGGFSSVIDVRPDEIIQVKQSSLSYEELACIPESFSTAYFNLCIQGSLSYGGEVLIYSAAGGVGLSALQITDYLGSKATGIVGSELKGRYLEKLGFNEWVNYKEDRFIEFIKESENRFTHILNTVGAGSIKDNIYMCKQGGRILLIGLLNGVKEELDLSLLLRKNIQILGSTLRSQSYEIKTILLKFIEEQVLTNMTSVRPKFHPCLDSVFNFKSVFEAFSRIKQSENTGNVVLKWDI